jgi:hypothetical protein
MLLDVLHFLDPAAQESLLARLRRSLPPGGVLLLRVSDAAGGAGFWWTQVVDHGVACWRGHGWPRFHCRTQNGWEALLKRLGFACESLPMGNGPFFANVLLIGRPGLTGGPQAAAPIARAAG